MFGESMTTLPYVEPDAKPERHVHKAVYAIAAMFVLAVVTLGVLNAIAAARIRRINDHGGLVKSGSDTVFAPIVYPLGYRVVNWYEYHFVLRSQYEVYFGDTGVAVGCGSGLTLWSSPTREIDAGDESLRLAKDLRGVYVLSLLHTSVTDAGLVHIREMPDLVNLDLGSTKIQGPGLGYLRGLQLQELSLHKAPVNDAGLASLPEMPSLKTLDLGGTKVTGAGLAHLRHYRSLTSLGLSRTQIVDDDIRELVDLPLESLNLYNTPITDAALPYLEKMPKLRNVHLCGTQVTTKAASQSSSAPVREWVLMKDTFCKQIGHGLRP